jgi:hypothetical protein
MTSTKAINRRGIRHFLRILLIKGFNANATSKAAIKGASRENSGGTANMIKIIASAQKAIRKANLTYKRLRFSCIN